VCRVCVSLGAAWTKSVFDVMEGFTTTFQFQFTEPSNTCSTAQMQTEYCKTRGGNGIAFVIYGEDRYQEREWDLTKLLGSKKVGLDDKGMGYEGLRNSVVVEFDSFYDKSRGDLFENHIGVMTRGHEHPVSADHRYSLGSTANVPEFGHNYRRSHLVKIRYEPILRPDVIIHDDWCVKSRGCNNFQHQPYFTELFLSGHFPMGKIGTLWVYVDDLRYPRLVVPMRLETVLDLNHR
jgi:hypothetical protein